MHALRMHRLTSMDRLALWSIFPLMMRVNEVSVYFLYSHSMMPRWVGQCLEVGIADRAQYSVKRFCFRVPYYFHMFEFVPSIVFKTAFST